MHQLTLLRHGLSLWNLENRFTGWTDVDVSELGKSEAKDAGFLLRKEGFTFDRVYTSVLKRSIHTAWIVLDQLDQAWLPMVKNWRLNERHYGMLQGLNKAKIAHIHGDRQVQLWRRGYHARPPAMAEDDARNTINDLRYAGLPKDKIPLSENLEDVFNRAIPYWQKTIAPRVKRGERILIVAHGNTIRALVKYFDHLSDKDIEEVEIPTGIPLIYELDSHLNASSKKYLATPVSSPPIADHQTSH